MVDPPMLDHQRVEHGINQGAFPWSQRTTSYHPSCAARQTHWTCDDMQLKDAWEGELRRETDKYEEDPALIAICGTAPGGDGFLRDGWVDPW